ncbi:MAG: hypothetical protein O3A76_13615 [Chloroflexi bacterium]|nr:hypothetical protein [Chloroflexota bacterium]
MENACQLWIELHPEGGRRHDESHLYLQFRRSNLLARLSGPGLSDDELDEVVLRDTDALGLGLRAEDFAEGVAVCRDDAAGEMLGWRCRTVRMVGLTEDGRTAELSDRRAVVDWLGAA